jgi:hypothetical protein
MTIRSCTARNVVSSTPTDPAGPVYAVVRFDGSARQVAEVIVPFENVLAADRFATGQGMGDYTIAPIGFHLATEVGTEVAAVRSGAGR